MASGDGLRPQVSAGTLAGRMPEYRVTKYDPAVRDERGAFLRNDWTAYSDVGTAVSAEEYAKVEEAYLRAASTFMMESGVSRLAVRGLESLNESPSPLVEGMFLAPGAWHDAFRLVLRNQLWCRFEAGAAFVHFGYDFYMYVGVPSACVAAAAAAQRDGLFVEAFESPYRDAG